ncbi:hypothetical protein NHX12_005497 [Muraenolepis orangiensis]|uniref:Uncharacterized protein n=1 Tax=Muraenolepis orangiensis TaxID=630683 RepID=A0A9Q0DT12_9TELE|nr:hypothetical protein NHX12_005497 [Muraenolepis orangiensis]
MHDVEWALLKSIGDISPFHLPLEWLLPGAPFLPWPWALGSASPQIAWRKCATGPAGAAELLREKGEELPPVTHVAATCLGPRPIGRRLVQPLKPLQEALFGTAQTLLGFI